MVVPSNSVAEPGLSAGSAKLYSEGGVDDEP